MPEDVKPIENTSVEVPTEDPVDTLEEGERLDLTEKCKNFMKDWDSRLCDKTDEVMETFGDTLGGMGSRISGGLKDFRESGKFHQLMAYSHKLYAAGFIFASGMKFETEDYREAAGWACLALVQYGLSKRILEPQGDKLRRRYEIKRANG